MKMYKKTTCHQWENPEVRCFSFTFICLYLVISAYKARNNLPSAFLFITCCLHMVVSKKMGFSLICSCHSGNSGNTGKHFHKQLIVKVSNYQLCSALLKTAQKHWEL